MTLRGAHMTFYSELKTSAVTVYCVCVCVCVCIYICYTRGAIAERINR